MSYQLKQFPNLFTKNSHALLSFNIQDVRMTADDLVNYFLDNTTLANIKKRLANFLIRCPLKTFREEKKGRIETTSLYSFVKSPNAQETLEMFLERLVNSYVISGECFVNGIKIGSNVQELWVLDPIAFQRNQLLTSKFSGVQLDSQGNIVAYNYFRNTVYRSFSKDEISHIFNPSPDFQQYFRGISEFFACKNSIDLIEQATDYNRSLVSQGGIPPMIVKMDGLTQKGGWGKDVNGEEISKLEYFRAALKKWFGTKNAGKSQLVDKNTEIETLAFNVDEMQLNETMKRAEQRIIQCLSGTAGAFGDISDQNYNTLLEQRLDTFENVLVPFSRKIASVFNKFLKNNEYAEFDFSKEQIIQALTAKKLESKQEEYKLNLITRNEYREIAGYELLDKEDVYFVNKISAASHRNDKNFDKIIISNEGIKVSNSFDNAINKAKAIQTIILKKIDTKKAWDKFNKATNPLIETLEEKFFNVYKSLEEMLLRKNAKGLEEDFAKIDWDTIEKLFKNVISSNSYEIIESGYQHLIKIIDESGNLLITDSRVENYIKLREEYAADMTKTVKKQIERQLKIGVELQESEYKLGKRIQKFFKDIALNDAGRIARTEVTAAFNQGQLEAIKEFKIENKMWISERDDRVRDEHVQLDGVIILANEEFSNGLQYPSEPNCRCTLFPVKNTEDN